ncbi:unnamed protein product [Gongylonema pulchrum]|uniref:FCH domain-containing protein n=1 Tax=Gongylonema pulchrum TaxID=637853 RepID=A0A183E402_9BILA|nr:unnamed protein product [Gongylonema pulchrum]
MDGLSFYDIGGYRENIRRYKEGIDQLCDIQAMIRNDLLQERVDIETSYSKCLQAYNDKWSTHIGGLAASALQDVWRDVLEESMELQRLHGHVRDRICEEVIFWFLLENSCTGNFWPLTFRRILKTIALYLKDNHHPSPFRASKELREIEEDFERAQRTWRRQYEKVEKAKKAFHAASKAERTAQVQMRNACGDATISLDIESKQRDRYQKCQDELAKTERAYCATLENLNNMKKSYISHMSDVC